MLKILVLLTLLLGAMDTGFAGNLYVHGSNSFSEATLIGGFGSTTGSGSLRGVGLDYWLFGKDGLRLGAIYFWSSLALNGSTTDFSSVALDLAQVLSVNKNWFIPFGISGNSGALGSRRNFGFGVFAGLGYSMEKWLFELSLRSDITAYSLGGSAPAVLGGVSIDRSQFTGVNLKVSYQLM
jgi:hypothetical protein